MNHAHDFLAPSVLDLDEVFTLSAAHVDLWRGRLDQDQKIVERCYAILNSDERDRAGRYRFEELRRRFVVTRGGLRILLGKYLLCAPQAVTFVYNGYGRPELDRAVHLRASSLAFNLSHAGDEVVYAVSGLPDVGVDVERHRKQDRLEALAQRYFALAEFEAWSNLSAEQRVDGFFAAWTRKEAYIKAHGRGLSYPLHQFVVSLAPGEPARLIATHDEPSEAAKWRIEDVIWGAGYSAAVVGSAGDWSVRKFLIQELLEQIC
jgi:4'-phosphopantetheinyl transferase